MLTIHQCLYFLWHRSHQYPHFFSQCDDNFITSHLKNVEIMKKLHFHYEYSYKNIFFHQIWSNYKQIIECNSSLIFYHAGLCQIFHKICISIPSTISETHPGSGRKSPRKSEPQNVGHNFEMWSPVSCIVLLWFQCPWNYFAWDEFETGKALCHHYPCNCVRIFHQMAMYLQ